MACTQSLPILELALLDWRDMNTLILADESTYLSVPDAAHLSLQITPPGSDTISVTFTPLSVNIYKCVDLGITCADTGCTPLPDGIYDIIYVVLDTNNVATTIERKFIKIDQIKCKWQKTFLKVDLQCACHDHTQDKYIKELYRAKLLIDGSVAESNDSNYVASFDFYQQAEYIIDHICCRFGLPHSSCGFTSACKACQTC